MLQKNDFTGDKISLWTKQESIQFECAQEIIGHMIGVCFDRIRLEKLKSTPDLTLLAKLKEEERKLHEERMELTWKDHAKIEKIFTDYGSKIKAYSASKKTVHLDE